MVRETENTHYITVETPRDVIGWRDFPLLPMVARRSSTTGVRKGPMPLLFYQLLVVPSCGMALEGKRNPRNNQ